jgi:hypothetical protein
MAVLRQAVYFEDRYMPPVEVVLQRRLTLGGNSITILITLSLHPFAVQNGNQVAMHI